MVEGEGVGRLVRRMWPLAEKRRIVDLTLEPGASVALVARSNGLNSNQVFSWRRAFERGELSEVSPATTALLPVTVSVADEMAIAGSAKPEHLAMRGSIHIEFPGRATIRVESGADALLLRSILECLAK